MKNTTTLLPTSEVGNLFSALTLLIDLCREYNLYTPEEYEIKLISILDIINELDEKFKKSVIEVSITDEQRELLNNSTSQIMDKILDLRKKDKRELEFIKSRLCKDIE